LRAGEVAVGPEPISLLLRAVDVLRALMGGDVAPANLAATRRALHDARNGDAHDGDAHDVQAAEPAAGPAETRTLRIDVTKLDRMLDLTGEIAIARGRIAQMLAALPDGLGREILEAHLGAERLQFELQEQVTKARMVPIGPFFRQYGRTVRDLAHAHGKSVQLRIEGEDVEVDTRVVERLRDPLTHMLRNAIDHGIESTDLRAALDKPLESTVTVRLPLTLAIIDGFGVGVGAETYVIPLDAVLECLSLPAETHDGGAGNGVVNLRGEPLPFLRLRDRLGVPGERPRREHVVV